MRSVTFHCVQWAEGGGRRAQAQAVELSLAEAHRQRGAQGAPAPEPARPRSGGAAALVPASVLGLSAECAPPSELSCYTCWLTSVASSEA